MAWQQLQKSQSHEPATPTELSFSFAELLSIRSSTPEPGAPLSTVVRRILECAVAVGKNRGHRHHCGHRSRVCSLTRMNERKQETKTPRYSSTPSETQN